MTSQTQARLLEGIALVCAVGLGLIFGVLARDCACSKPWAPISAGIDAGPGDRAIAGELDASLQREDQHIRELEAQHAQAIAALSEQEQREYEAVRARGRDALARWLKERTARLLGDAGSPTSTRGESP